MIQTFQKNYLLYSLIGVFSFEKQKFFGHCLRSRKILISIRFWIPALLKKKWVSVPGESPCIHTLFFRFSVRGRWRTRKCIILLYGQPNRSAGHGTPPSAPVSDCRTKESHTYISLIAISSGPRYNIMSKHNVKYYIAAHHDGGGLLVAIYYGIILL